jgi:hypothetical protein
MSVLNALQVSIAGLAGAACAAITCSTAGARMPEALAAMASVRQVSRARKMESMMIVSKDGKLTWFDIIFAAKDKLIS